jgi:hypothetical protein
MPRRKDSEANGSNGSNQEKNIREFIDMLFQGLDAEVAERIEEHEEAIKAAQAMHEQAAVHMIAVRMGDFRLAEVLARKLHFMIDGTIMGHRLTLSRQDPAYEDGYGE